MTMKRRRRSTSKRGERTHHPVPVVATYDEVEVAPFDGALAEQGGRPAQFRIFDRSETIWYGVMCEDDPVIRGRGRFAAAFRRVI